jgi:hypothetical protein
VGFGREGGRVRDLSLPARYRLHALGSRIQLAQPIGFNATWSYLQAKVQRPWRDPEFPLPAIGLLEAERAVHLGIDAEFARERREQKAAGLRFPPRSHVTPADPRRPGFRPTDPSARHRADERAWERSRDHPRRPS